MTFCAPGSERPLLRNFSYDFSPEDRVGIIGPNGSGKSTLLDLIAGRRQPQEGRLELGSTVQLAYFDQQSGDLVAGKGMERKVIDFVKEAASQIDLGGVQVSASQLLERFLFPPAQQHSPISKLSGGERRRLALCRLLIQAPNVLLLDEPTNDLDVHTLTVLEDFLEDFRGCVVVVSHDRYFLDRTVDRLFSFEAGELKRFEGNYSAYLEQAVTAKPQAKPPAAPPTKQPSSAGQTLPRRRRQARPFPHRQLGGAATGKTANSRSWRATCPTGKRSGTAWSVSWRQEVAVTMAALISSPGSWPAWRPAFTRGKSAGWSSATGRLDQLQPTNPLVVPGWSVGCG